MPACNGRHRGAASPLAALIASRVFRTGALLSASHAVIAIATIPVVLKVIVALGPERFGLYSAIVAFLSFFGMFTISSGVDDLMIADLAGVPPNGGERDRYFTTVVLLRLMLGAVAFALVPVTAAIVGYDRSTILLMSLGGAGLLFHFSRRNSPLLAPFILEGRRLLPEAVLLVFTLGMLGARFAAAARGADVPAFVILDVAQIAGLSLLFALLRTRCVGARFRFSRFDGRLALELMRRSFPISVTALLTSLLMRVDQVMLSTMIGMRAVGFYSASVYLVEAPTFLAIIAYQVLVPVFARGKGDRIRHEASVALAFRAIMMLATAYAACVFLYAPELLSLLWRDQYLASAHSARVLVWSLPFAFAGFVSLALILSTEQQRVGLRISGAQLAANALLNLLLIPRLGITGAAVSSLVSYGLGFVLMPVAAGLRSAARLFWGEALLGPLPCALCCLVLPQLGWGRAGALAVVAVLLAGTTALTLTSRRWALVTGKASGGEAQAPPSRRSHNP